MNKLKLLFAGLCLSGALSAQTTVSDSISFTKYEVIEIINTIEDILDWQQQDIEEGDTSCGSYEEGWGSNYWLTLIAIELRAKLNK